MTYEGKENLEFLERLAKKYNRFLAFEFIRAFHNAGMSQDDLILDFGAGIGTLAREIQSLLPNPIHCLEIDIEMCESLERAGFQSFSDIEGLSRSYKFIYMSNVLEHIEQDVATLSELRHKVSATPGVLVIYVPAFEILFSEMDKQVGHFRRYSKASVRQVVLEAGWREVSCEYVDSLGFLSVFILKFLLRKDLSISSSSSILIKIYDRFFFPLSRVIDKMGARHFLGKNLLLVASNV
jgi:hypothetical protein